MNEPILIYFHFNLRVLFSKKSLGLLTVRTPGLAEDNDDIVVYRRLIENRVMRIRIFSAKLEYTHVYKILNGHFYIKMLYYSMCIDSL